MTSPNYVQFSIHQYIFIYIKDLTTLLQFYGIYQRRKRNYSTKNKRSRIIPLTPEDWKYEYKKEFDDKNICQPVDISCPPPFQIESINSAYQAYRWRIQYLKKKLIKDNNCEWIEDHLNDIFLYVRIYALSNEYNKYSSTSSNDLSILIKKNQLESELTMIMNNDNYMYIINTVQLIMENGILNAIVIRQVDNIKEKEETKEENYQSMLIE
jgi:hypothetical protein